MNKLQKLRTLEAQGKLSANGYRHLAELEARYGSRDENTEVYLPDSQDWPAE